MVAKATDEPVLYKWSSTFFDTYTTSGIFGGAQNTKKSIHIAVANGYTCPAANVCDTLSSGTYTDWYLPSKDELDMMYVNLHLQSLGDFNISNYWSSTEVNDATGWIQNFNTGVQGGYPKIINLGVRAIRAF